jgi:hypothetical protein
MAKTKIIYGKKKCKKYKKVTMDKLVGETVEAIGFTKLPGGWGDEPCYTLYCSNGKQHGFVVATDPF